MRNTTSGYSFTSITSQSLKSDLPTVNNEVSPISFEFSHHPSLSLSPCQTQLQYALQEAQDKLQKFASSSSLHELNLVFGNAWDHEAMQNLLSGWQHGNFSNLPNFDLLTGFQLKSANGAYSSESNTIYLSSDFLLNNADNTAAITNVILEEIGHAIDRKINAMDTSGDEGDLFQRVIQGNVITSSEIAILKTEDDTTIINLDGQNLLVEQSTSFVGTSDGTVNIRTGAGTNNSIVGTLSLNQRVTFDSVATGTNHWDARENRYDNRWFRIQGTNNWVSAAFITGNPISTPVAPAPSNTFFGTSDGTVNIRTGAGTNNSIVGTLSLNQRVTFDSVATGTNHWDARENRYDNRWFRIQGTNNWVSAAFITGNPDTIVSVPSNSSGSTGGQNIVNAVSRVNPDQWFYRPRDITGDGRNETFCNWFAADVLEVMGVPIPRHSQTYNSPVFGIRQKPISAEGLFNFFKSGGSGKWRAVNAVEATSLANQGRAVVASSYGHIAIVIPGGSVSNVRIAQAGAVNGKNLSVTQGFGSFFSSYFTYVA